MIVIGSTAIKRYFPDFKREPKDLDIAVDFKTRVDSTRRIEFLENPILQKYENGIFLSPDLMLTLKMSHLFWEINWNKHMFDVQFLLEKGCKYDKDIFMELYEYWKTVKPPVRRSKLDMSKEDFFTNAINYDEHEHDDLHEIINPNPIYKKLLIEGEEVETSEENWNKLTHEEKCEAIREEVYVMAYERYKDKGFRFAYGLMLKKFIRQHAPIYMMLFAIENYREILNPKINFIQTINNGLQKVK